jgi:hypothetical protein
MRTAFESAAGFAFIGAMLSGAKLDLGFVRGRGSGALGEAGDRPPPLSAPGGDINANEKGAG